MMKTNFFLFLYAIFVLEFALCSCQGDITAETPTLIPALTHTPTSVPKLISTSTISIETLRSDASYMAGCKTINPNPVNEQVSYKGIYPGRTTKSDVEDTMGKPLRTPDLTSWEYGDVTVFFDELIVDKLFVTGNNVTTLRDMVVQYGCPGAIYALDINEEKHGNYARLLFVYPSIGFHFTLDSIPADLNEKITTMSYFIPSTLEHYIDSMCCTLTDSNTSKPMSWDEAVH